MEEKEIIKEISKYKPLQKRPWIEKTRWEFLNAAQEFLKKETRTPEEFNIRDNIKSYLLDWATPGSSKYLKKVEELDSELELLNESDPLENSEDTIRFQCGTSKSRAELFIESGEGYVMLEKLYKINGKPCMSGIQVSERGGSCRSGFDKLSYYAREQARKTWDEPVILVGEIQKKYIYPENNTGEYAIPRIFYKEIKGAKILTIDDYKKEEGI